jgi:hypothetical protein
MMMQNDVNGLQQQDDAEYGDEIGQPMQISNALAEQRATKKRAQDDVKLLANRIALLKLEEKKVSFFRGRASFACQPRGPADGSLG